MLPLGARAQPFVEGLETDRQIVLLTLSRQHGFPPPVRGVVIPPLHSPRDADRLERGCGDIAGVHPLARLGLDAHPVSRLQADAGQPKAAATHANAQVESSAALCRRSLSKRPNCGAACG
eukprot:6177954-Pleurochrysis_carterae.AAC.2